VSRGFGTITLMDNKRAVDYARRRIAAQMEYRGDSAV
jgi:hypothetical protein